LSICGEEVCDDRGDDRQEMAEINPLAAFAASESIDFVPGENVNRCYE